MKVSELKWKYKIEEPDEDFGPDDDHVLLAADTPQNVRFFVFKPLWTDELFDAPATGTGFITPECTAWSPGIDITQKQYANGNLGKAMNYLIQNHVDFFSSTLERLLAELPPVCAEVLN